MADKDIYSHHQDLTDKIEQDAGADQFFYMESMKELGFVDKTGRPQYKMLDEAENAQKLGDLIEKKRANHFQELYDNKLEELDHAMVYQNKFGENVGDARRNAIQQGKNYNLAFNQQRIAENTRRKNQIAAGYATRDVTTTEDFKKLLGDRAKDYNIRDLSPEEAQRGATQIVANTNVDNIYDQITRSYRKTK